MSTLPLPKENQAYCTVSVLEAGHLYCRQSLLLDNANQDSTQHLPCLAFLLRHSSKKENFLFDLGTAKNWEDLPPKLVNSLAPEWTIKVPRDVIQSLAKGGITPQNIDTSQFFVGPETPKLFEDGLYPENPDAYYRADLLPVGRTNYLKDVSWEPIGPFPRAYDFYGDGSLYIIDAPGHIWGHVNLLARTSSDGGWVYLAGDTAHHWNLITGKSRMACVHPGVSTIHRHKELAEEMIRRVGEVMKIPRVRVMLAHDKIWWDENEGTESRFPTSLKSL